jgi:hypothetical protein
MKRLDKAGSADNETARESLERNMSDRISRRSFIRWSATGIGVAAALPLFGGSSEAAQAMTSGQGEPASARDSGAAAREREEMVKGAADQALSLLVAPIAVGTRLGSARVETIEVDARGVGVVTLADDRGRKWDAEICRRTVQDANVRPLATTKHYSVYLRNNGSGSVPTDEKVGRAVLAVGDRVRANEQKLEVLALRSRKELWQAQGYLG